MKTETINKQVTLRGYQEPASDFAMKHDIAVLAMCPNGGKTEISIDVIERYLNLYPKNKVIIFAHSTNVLLDNYIERLKGLNLKFTWSVIGTKEFKSKHQVHICLPNSENKIKLKYDFLIVDEAHENYLAERVQRIIRKIKPKKQLLLTGTPSKFIKKGGYNIFTLAMNEISDKWFAKLNIELVTSNYNWLGNYNRNMDINDGFKYTAKETEKTLEAVLLKLLERLKRKCSAEEFNRIKFIPKVKSKVKDKLEDWGIAYNKIGKTMIICNETEHADIINNILIKHNVKCVVSHSKNDSNSDNVIEFKNNKHDVLIVVDRARLGYSDVDLYNIIDMSGTHNPDIIYQIFARVLRGNPKMQKYYLKVTPQGNGGMDLTHMSVCAALMLTDKKYLSTFNGGNLNGIPVIILKNPKKIKKTIGSCTTNSKQSRPVFPEFRHDIIDMFKDIIADLNKSVSIYKLTTIGEVRYQLGELERQIWDENKVLKTITG